MNHVDMLLNRVEKLQRRADNLRFSSNQQAYRDARRDLLNAQALLRQARKEAAARGR